VKVVMTLVVRDERDIVEQHLAFHLAAGVDLVIVTDHASSDGTQDVLARYEAEGRARVIREPDGPFRQREWVTRMARLAAAEHGADWVISSDVDELWWPRGGDLRDVLASIPLRYGIVQSFVRHFVPVVENGEPWWERMILRLAPQAPVNDPRSPWRPFRKLVHRGDPDVEITEGSHGVVGTSFAPLRGWYPIEVLHFPVRTASQLDRKGRVWGSAVEKFYSSREVAVGPGAAYHALAHRDAVGGRSAEVFAALALDADGAREALEAGVVVEDTRVRDALRALAEPDGVLAFPRLSPVAEAAFAADAAVLGEADVVRVRRRLDELEGRIAMLEGRVGARAERRLRRLAGRALGRRP
jgi:hypothetical protein